MKKIGKRILALLLICVCTTLGITPPVLARNEIIKSEKKNQSSQTSTSLELTSPSVVLMEGSTGEILYEKDKDKQLMPASITKIMTLLLIFEALGAKKISLTDEVSVSEHAASMGGSQVYLEPYETQTVETMIKCISIASANDASTAMAEFISGTEEEFVKKMNEKAEKLNMKNTHFLNCCGLDDDITSGHYSTAYDIALMSRELITKYPEISTYSTIWMDTFTHVTRKGESEFGLTNTNKLIRTYDGITGLKTGSTSKAKYCLSATAKRNGMDLIAVIMAAPEPKVRFQEAAKLLDYGFANCSLYEDDTKKIELGKLSVTKGKEDWVTVAPEKNFTYVCLKGENKDEIKRKVQLYDKIEAPFSKAVQVGKIIYYYNGDEIGNVPIITTQSMEKALYGDILKKVWFDFLLVK